MNVSSYCSSGSSQPESNCNSQVPGSAVTVLRFARFVGVAPDDMRAARHVNDLGVDFLLVEHHRHAARWTLTAQPVRAIAEPVRADNERRDQIGAEFAERMRMDRAEGRFLVRRERMELCVEVVGIGRPTSTRAQVEHTPGGEVYGEVQVVPSVKRPRDPRTRIGAAVAGHVVVGNEEQREGDATDQRGEPTDDLQ